MATEGTQHVHSGDFLAQVPSAAQDTLWPMSLTEAADVGLVLSSLIGLRVSGGAWNFHMVVTSCLNVCPFVLCPSSLVFIMTFSVPIAAPTAISF